MANMSDYLENKLIDHIFRGTAYTAPVTLYAALYTALPGDAGGGTEVTGGSYARVAITSGTAAWANTQNSGIVASAGTGGTTSNSATITFPAPTAAWGSIVGMALYDAATAGNEMIWGALTTAKTVNSGDPAPSFAIGALTFQIDN